MRGSSVNALMACVLAILTGCTNGLGDKVGRVSVIARGGHFGQAIWSPDGQHIVSIHRGQDGYTRVEILSADGKDIKSPVKSPRAQSPGWFDSNAVFLEVDVMGANSTLNKVGPNGVEILRRVPGVFLASWPRSGGNVILAKSGPDSIWVMNLDSGEMRQVHVGVTQRVKVSPLGRYVAFTNHRSSSVSVLDLKSGQATVLWEVPAKGNALGGLTWSPDEQYLGVRRTGDPREAGLYLIDLQNGSTPVRLTTIDMVDPDWSPTGDRIVYTTVGVPGENELRVLTLEADWRKKITK